MIQGMIKSCDDHQQKAGVIALPFEARVATPHGARAINLPYAYTEPSDEHTGAIACKT